MNGRVVFALVMLIGALSLGGCSAGTTVPKDARAPETAGAKHGSVSPSAGTSASAGTGVSTRPGSQNPMSAPTRPNTPVKAGVKLPSLEAPPEKALAMIKLPAGFSGARFELTVSPYGWGPAPKNATREQLLVRIETLKGLDAGAKTLERLKANSNAVLNLEGALANRKLVATGGKYTATIFVRPEGDVGAFCVEKIAALKK